MKRVYLIMVMVVIGAALIFQGCGLKWQVPTKDEPLPPAPKIIRAEKADKTITQPARIVRDKAPDKKTNFVPEKKEIVYDHNIISVVDLKKYPPLKPTQRRNVAQIRQRMAQTGLEPHFINKSHLVRNRAPNGRWVIQRAQNVLYLGHWTQERSTGKKIFTPVEIAECGNQADGFREVVTPAKIFVTTTYRDREIVTVVERYRDTVVIKKITPPPKKEGDRINPLDYNYDGGGGGGSCGPGGPGGR